MGPQAQKEMWPPIDANPACAKHNKSYIDRYSSDRLRRERRGHEAQTAQIQAARATKRGSKPETPESCAVLGPKRQDSGLKLPSLVRGASGSTFWACVHGATSPFALGGPTATHSRLNCLPPTQRGDWASADRKKGIWHPEGPPTQKYSSRMP